MVHPSTRYAVLFPRKLAVYLGLACCGWPAPPQESSTRADDIGICAALPSSRPEADQRKRVEIFKQAGVTLVRSDFRWRVIEQARGAYQFEPNDVSVKVARESGVRMLGLISHTPQWAAPLHEHFDEWLAFVETTVRRYPYVRHWEMFNEPNLASFWGSAPDPAHAAELVRLTYKKIKSVDPSLTAVFPGLAGGGNATGGYPAKFLEGMFAAGVAGSYDAMAIHPYRYPHAPEEAHYANNVRQPDKWPLMTAMRKIRDLMDRYGDGAKPLWITEYGYPTHTATDVINLGVTESEQADFLSRSILLAFQSGVSAFFWFTTQTLERNPDDKEHWFGIVHPDYSPRPAYWAMHALRRAYPAGSALSRERFQSGPVYCASWKRPDGKTGWALWIAERGVEESFDAVGTAAPVTVANGKATVTLTGRILYLIGPERVNP